MRNITIIRIFARRFRSEKLNDSKRKKKIIKKFFENNRNHWNLNAHVDYKISQTELQKLLYRYNWLYCKKTEGIGSSY